MRNDRRGGYGSRDGGSRDGGGRESRNGDSRGGDRGGRGGRGGGRGGFRRGGRGRNPMRGTAVSGNQRERIAIESGFLVFIDQFMLANPQFIERLKIVEDKDPAEKDNVIKEFGGNVVHIEPGLYRIERDPFTTSIMIHKDGDQLDPESINKETATKNGEVYIDTRCVAMIDRELLDDNTLLEKYQQLWFSGEDKACRDLLRDNGGAVRYGFNRNGDNLGIYEAAQNTICIWPL